MNEFEEHLRKQSPRRIPGEWRHDILQAARDASAPRSPARPAQPWREFLRDLLWPAPAAWGALAAIWLLLIGFNLASAGSVRPVCAQHQATPPSPAVRTALEEQKQLWAELRGLSPAPASPPAPGPRSRNETAPLQTT